MQRTSIIAIFVAALAMSFGASAAKRRVLVYQGKLLDERAAPIGGVFPLTFAFYGKSRGGQALWQEQHFVAVDNGTYTIELGRQKTIPNSVGLDQLYVGVRITGGPELVRERFVAENTNEEVIHEQGTNTPKPGAQAGGTVDYAEKAGFAYVAEKSDNSTRIDGLTLDQLKKQIAAEGGGGGGGGGGAIGIGEQTFNAPSAGGEGGTPFQQLCPEGYVVTGLRGGSGLYIDRMAIICSPIEAKKPTKPAP